MSHYLDLHIKKPKYLVTTHTSAQVTTSTPNQGVVITGSEITYEPDPDATKVVYEIGFYGEKKEQTMFMTWYLQEYSSGSWSEINSRYRRNFGNGDNTNQTYRWNIHFRFVLPAWTGSKQLRILAGMSGSNRNISLNQLTEWDGSSATDKFCNTNLLVYSI